MGKKGVRHYRKPRRERVANSSFDDKEADVVRDRRRKPRWEGGRVASNSLSGDVETSEGKTREERLQMYMENITEFGRRIFGPDDKEVDENGCHEMTLREFCSHELDMIENGGFDIGDYSKVSDLGVMIRLYDPPEKPMAPGFQDHLEDSSRLAIADYNNKKRTRYAFTNLVKANLEPLCPYRLYITFEATDSRKRDTQIFQARVNFEFPGMEKDVELVQIKTEPKPMLITRPRRTSPSPNCSE